MNSSSETGSNNIDSVIDRLKSMVKPNSQKQSNPSNILTALCEMIDSKKDDAFNLKEKPKYKNNCKDKNKEAYNNYCNFFIANQMIIEKIKETMKHKEDLMGKLNGLHETSVKTLNNIEEQNGNKKKRHRRTISEIDRQFQCPINKCEKAYGNESSLHQHIKSKHEKYWQKNGNELMK